MSSPSGAREPIFLFDEASVVFYADDGRVPFAVGERLGVQLVRLKPDPESLSEDQAYRECGAFVACVVEVRGFSIDEESRPTVQIERDDESVIVCGVLSGVMERPETPARNVRYVERPETPARNVRYVERPETPARNVRYSGSGADLAVECFRAMGEDVDEVTRFLDEIHSTITRIQTSTSTRPYEMALRHALSDRGRR